MHINPSARTIGIQHHHAHIASCMAENSVSEDVIGVAFDGTGYGADFKIWGAEFIVANYNNFKRLYHLRYIPLPGADKAAQEPWRMAVSYIYQAFGKDAHRFIRRWKNGPVILRMLQRQINSPLGSSMGRLFDAVSSIAGICDINSYEGEAAIKLEAACKKGISGRYQYRITANGEIDVSPMIRKIVRQHEGTSVVAARFHNTIAEIILNTCLKIGRQCKIKSVALSGGVFFNKFLTEKTAALLRDAGFSVFTHSKVSPGDAGISLGQAVIAREAACA